MKKRIQRYFCVAICLLAVFTLWTVLVCYVDVKPIGPEGSSVGFSALNGFVHNLVGVRTSLYIITDWLGLVPIATAAGFAIFGLAQWIKRKNILKVDSSVLVLGVFYIAVIAVYALFEVLVINYRPVLIEGILEASYPSSTTLLVMCVMPTAAMQLNGRIKHNGFRLCAVLGIIVFITFMIIGRVLSGVHWITDIIGGALLSSGLVLLYRAVYMCYNKMNFQEIIHK